MPHIQTRFQGRNRYHLIAPERFRRVLVSDKALSPELAAEMTHRAYGTLHSEVPA